MFETKYYTIAQSFTADELRGAYSCNQLGKWFPIDWQAAVRRGDVPTLPDCKQYRVALIHAIEYWVVIGDATAKPVKPVGEVDSKVLEIEQWALNTANL